MLKILSLDNINKKKCFCFVLFSLIRNFAAAFSEYTY